MKGVKTIGIVGGGQLGRMLTLAAAPLGFRVIVVNPEANGPAAQVGADEIVASLQDKKALEELAKRSDFITVEIEHFDTAALDKIAKRGTPVNPSPLAIQAIQNKFHQKQLLEHNGIQVAEFADFGSVGAAKEHLKQWGGEMYIKSKFNAYDGRGNFYVTTPKGVDSLADANDIQALYLEKKVSYAKELSVMVAKDLQGNVKSYPATETIHKRSICIETITPAEIPKHIHKKATELAQKTVACFEGAGVFGVEMFLSGLDTLLVNEVAPRVHNSGHFTMNACVTSQFEQHIRATAGLPLGDTSLTSPCAVMVNILGEQNGPTHLKGLNKALAIPGVSVHIYGKSPTKVDRKMGHINAIGSTIKQARDRARKARKLIDI
jgi:5-(carboxyamino)imidazole ribonucleotide synthase